MREKASLIPIYCPECAKAGKQKLLMMANPEAKGKIYPFCKIHRNVEVTLPLKIHN